MSGSSAKIVPEINLDEFERRLRSAGASPSVAEDPLAELTRLVNMISLDSGKRDPVDEASQAHMPKAAGFPPAANDAPVARFEPRASRPRDAAAGREPPPAPLLGEAVRPPAGAAEELDLSAGVLAATRTADGEAEARKGAVALLALQDRWVWRRSASRCSAARSAMKTGVVPGLPKTPPFIAAADGPNKIQPPSDATVQSSGDTAALLMKDSATSAPVKVVSTEEQPVDLARPDARIPGLSPPPPPLWPHPLRPPRRRPPRPPARRWRPPPIRRSSRPPKRPPPSLRSSPRPSRSRRFRCVRTER